MIKPMLGSPTAAGKKIGNLLEAQRGNMLWGIEGWMQCSVFSLVRTRDLYFSVCQSYALLMETVLLPEIVPLLCLKGVLFFFKHSLYNVLCYNWRPVLFLESVR